MYYLGVIDSSIGDVQIQDIPLWGEQIQGFFCAASNRFRWIDCEEDGMRNVIAGQLASLFGNKDCNLRERKIVEESWRQLQQFLFRVNESCSCEHSPCTRSKNISSLRTKTNPNCIVFYKENPNMPNLDFVDLDNHRQWQKFSSLNQPWRDGPIPNFQTGIDYITKGWGELFKVCNKVRILDRNVFPFWNKNYKAGLSQFATAIAAQNPDVILEIVTVINDHRTDSSKSKWDIRDEIKQIVTRDSSSYIEQPRLEFRLCDRGDELIDHNRYLLIDNVLGADIGTGLDAFTPKRRDNRYRFKVTYENVLGVKRLFEEALMSETVDKDFQGIKNY